MASSGSGGSTVAAPSVNFRLLTSLTIADLIIIGGYQFWFALFIKIYLDQNGHSAVNFFVSLLLLGPVVIIFAIFAALMGFVDLIALLRHARRLPGQPLTVKFQALVLTLGVILGIYALAQTVPYFVHINS